MSCRNDVMFLLIWPRCVLSGWRGDASGVFRPSLHADPVSVRPEQLPSNQTTTHCEWNSSNMGGVMKTNDLRLFSCLEIHSFGPYNSSTDECIGYMRVSFKHVMHSFLGKKGGLEPINMLQDWQTCFQIKYLFLAVFRCQRSGRWEHHCSSVDCRQTTLLASALSYLAMLSLVCIWVSLPHSVVFFLLLIFMLFVSFILLPASPSRQGGDVKGHSCGV